MQIKDNIIEKYEKYQDIINDICDFLNYPVEFYKNWNEFLEFYPNLTEDELFYFKSVFKDQKNFLINYNLFLDLIEKYEDVLGISGVNYAIYLQELIDDIIDSINWYAMNEYEYETINNESQLESINYMYIKMSEILEIFNSIKNIDLSTDEINDEINITIYPYLNLILDNNEYKVYAIHEYTHTIAMSRYAKIREIDNVDKKIVNTIEKYIKDDIYTMTDMYCDIYDHDEYIEFINETMNIPDNLTYYIDYNQILYDMQINGEAVAVKVYYVNEKYELDYINVLCVLKEDE